MSFRCNFSIAHALKQQITNFKSSMELKMDDDKSNLGYTLQYHNDGFVCEGYINGEVKKLKTTVMKEGDGNAILKTLEDNEQAQFICLVKGNGNWIFDNNTVVMVIVTQDHVLLRQPLSSSNSGHYDCNEVLDSDSDQSVDSSSVMNDSTYSKFEVLSRGRRDSKRKRASKHKGRSSQQKPSASMPKKVKSSKPHSKPAPIFSSKDMSKFKTKSPSPTLRSKSPFSLSRKEPPTPAPRKKVSTPTSTKSGLLSPKALKNLSPFRRKASPPAPSKQFPTPAPRKRFLTPAPRKRFPTPAPRKRFPTPAPRTKFPTPASKIKPIPAPRTQFPTPAPRRRSSSQLSLSNLFPFTRKASTSSPSSKKSPTPSNSSPILERRKTSPFHSPKSSKSKASSSKVKYPRSRKLRSPSSKKYKLPSFRANPTSVPAITHSESPERYFLSSKSSLPWEVRSASAPSPLPPSNRKSTNPTSVPAITHSKSPERDLSSKAYFPWEFKSASAPYPPPPSPNQKSISGGIKDIGKSVVKGFGEALLHTLEEKLIKDKSSSKENEEKDELVSEKEMDETNIKPGDYHQRENEELNPNEEMNEGDLTAGDYYSRGVPPLVDPRSYSPSLSRSSTQDPRIPYSSPLGSISRDPASYSPSLPRSNSREGPPNFEHTSHQPRFPSDNIREGPPTFDSVSSISRNSVDNTKDENLDTQRELGIPLENFPESFDPHAERDDNLEAQPFRSGLENLKNRIDPGDEKDDNLEAQPFRSGLENLENRIDPGDEKGDYSETQEFNNNLENLPDKFDLDNEGGDNSKAKEFNNDLQNLPDGFDLEREGQLSPPEQHVKVGQMAYFSCIEERKVKWEFNGGPLRPHVKVVGIEATRNNFIRIHVREGDEGNYTCRSEYSGILYRGKLIIDPWPSKESDIKATLPLSSSRRSKKDKAILNRFYIPDADEDLGIALRRESIDSFSVDPPHTHDPGDLNYWKYTKDRPSVLSEKYTNEYMKDKARSILSKDDLIDVPVNVVEKTPDTNMESLSSISQNNPTRAENCPSLMLENGEIIYHKKGENSIATFTCNSDHILIGSIQRQCTSSGEWSGDETKCTSNLESKHSDDEHGEVNTFLLFLAVLCVLF